MFDKSKISSASLDWSDGDSFGRCDWWMGEDFFVFDWSNGFSRLDFFVIPFLTNDWSGGSRSRKNCRDRMSA